MTQHSKDGKGAGPPDFSQFIHQQLSALSEAFAAGPLAQLRISTPQASVTLVKSSAVAKRAEELNAAVERRHGHMRSMHEYLPDGEPGRAYEVVSADVVGVFHAASDLPALGEIVEPERVMGYIEALKLRTPVRSGIAGRMVGQVAEEGQAVDFGETLFVIDSSPVADEPQEQAPEQEIEPPRL